MGYSQSRRYEFLISLSDISKWDTYNFDDMSYMFYNCNLLLFFPDITKWITNNDIDKSGIFDKFSSIQIFNDKNKLIYDESESKGIKENDIKNHNNIHIDKLKNNIIIEELYIELGETNNDINLFRTEKSFNIDVYFYDKKINIFKKNNRWKYNFNKEGYYELKIVVNDIITNFERFFEKNNNLISVDLSEFNSSNVTNMRNMFKKCKKLKEIKGLNKIITNKVEDMSGMFDQCIELEFLDLSNFNTSKVTDMSYMFNKCIKLKEIKGINKFNTNNVIDMSGMFQQCNQLDDLDLSNFCTSNVNNMGCMFNKCHELKKINGLNNFNTKNVCFNSVAN